MNDERQEDPADRVEVGDRVERQPAEQLRGAVAQPVGREGVGELVDREPDEQHDGDDDDERQELVRVEGHALPRAGGRR